MKITIEGTPKEVKELLQAVDSSEEQKEQGLDLNIRGVSSSLDRERVVKSMMHGLGYHGSDSSLVPEKGSITLHDNGMVEERWVDEKGIECCSTDISNIK